MADPVSLHGKRVLITGAARGIGAETAKRLASRGARVALVGLEPRQLAEVATSCGPEAVWFEADVTDWDALETAVGGTVEALGGIDAVVANAGIGGGGPVRLADPVAFERTIEVNLMGVWRTVRVCLPHVIASRGYVLCIASLAAAIPAPLMAAYCASKAGVEAFARSLGIEVSHLGVDVGVAYFSFLDSDLVKASDEHPAFTLMRTRMRGPVGRTYPVSAGAEAIVRGIERRSHTVVAPGWARIVVSARTLLWPMTRRQALPAIPEVERLVEEEIEQRGAAASAPVGPGGEAAMRAGARDRVPAAAAGGAEQATTEVSAPSGSDGDGAADDRSTVAKS